MKIMWLGIAAAAASVFFSWVGGGGSSADILCPGTIAFLGILGLVLD